MKNKFLMTMGLCGLLWAGCATDVANNTEDAKFALDNGDFASAITSATAALADDPQNAEAARLLASAYMGRGGFSMHDIAVKLLDLADETESNYRSLSTVLPADGDLNDMRLAIEALKGLEALDFDTLTSTSLTTDTLKDAAYDLGLTQMVFHYAIGLYQSGFMTDDTTFDVTNVDNDDADGFDDLAEAQEALVQFDDYLIAAGFDPSDDTGSFINEVRKTHCLMQGINIDEGYSLDTFQALLQCDLAVDSSLVDPSLIDGDFTDCSLANPENGSLSSDVIACFEDNTVLE